ncbi:MAG: hypothetical protein ACE5GX_03700 [Thermoanaerobaculia bacterium]
MPRHTHSTRFVRIALVALFAATLIGAGPCPQGEPDSAADSELNAAAALAEAQEREAQERLEEALAAESAANAAAEKARAAREELLAEREERLRLTESLRADQARLAARITALEAREQALAVREKELENFEANLSFQERELRDREAVVDEALAGTGDQPPDAADLESGEMDGWSPDDRGEERASSEGPELTTEPETVQASLQPGRLLEIEILETLTSRDSRVGDTFSARLVQDLRAEDGMLVVAAGAEVIGEVTHVKPLKSVGGRAALDIEFTHIVVSPTESIAISASFVELGADKRDDKKKIAGAAIVGAILGRVLGGDAEAAVAGAAAGAAIRTAVVARAKGKDAEIPAGEIVALQLEEVVTVEIEMTGPADG